MRPLGTFLLGMAMALLLRSTLLSGLSARGIVIDALAFTTVLWALRHGDTWGSTFGFAVGLLADIDAAHWLGRHALVLTLIGYAAGRLSGTLVRESARTQFVLIATATLVHQLWISAFEVGAAVTGLPYLLGRTLIATLVTASAGTLMLMGVRRLTGQPLFGNAFRTPSAD